MNNYYCYNIEQREYELVSKLLCTMVQGKDLGDENVRKECVSNALALVGETMEALKKANLSTVFLRRHGDFFESTNTSSAIILSDTLGLTLAQGVVVFPFYKLGLFVEQLNHNGYSVSIED